MQKLRDLMLFFKQMCVREKNQAKSRKCSMFYGQFIISRNEFDSYQIKLDLDS